MKTAQTIINDARFELTTYIITLMRKLDAYFETGKKNLMTAPEESVVIDFTDCISIPMISVGVDNSYLDVYDECHEIRPLDFIATTDDHNFYVSTDGVEIDADSISTDELVEIVKVLEKTYDKVGETGGEPDGKDAGYNYFKIDVAGENGYSFLVATKFNENEDSILQVAHDTGAFEDSVDYYAASAERVEKGDYDYEHLKETLIFLDAE